MAVEIEKKFLAHKDLLPKLEEGTTIIQGYLAEKPSVRFRVMGKTMTVTIKDYNEDGTRFELETPGKEISLEEKEKLMELAICPPIVKTRYKILYYGLTWEIDVYQGENEGLITVDVELPYPGYPLVFPEWVNSDKEITSNPLFSNINLGRKPYGKWTQEKKT